MVLTEVVLLYLHRQSLTFLEIQSIPVEPIKAAYLHRGSLQYEFATELLQIPIQLLRISNAEAQVLLLETLSFIQTFVEFILETDIGNIR